MKMLLDKFAAVLAATTAGLLLISVVYEAGYFSEIGRHLQTILTPSDYLANVILWLPYAAPMLWFWTMWETWGTPPPKLDWKDRASWKNWIGRLWPWLFVAFVVMTTTWPPFSLTVFGIMACVIIIWVRLWPKLMPPMTAVSEDVRALCQGAVRVGPPFLVIVFIWGAVAARWDLDRLTAPYLFRFKGSETSMPKIFLKSFDRGVLVRSPNSNRVEFHKWEDIVSFDKFTEGQRDSLSCRWLGICMLEKNVNPRIP